MIVKTDSTDVTTYFNLRLAASGAAATALTITDLDLQYTRSGVAPTAKVDATALAATDSAHGDNKAIEIDATDQPGLYRVDWPDAAFATGVREVILTVKHTTAFIEHLRVQLVAYNPADGVRLGLTALPNAAADAAGGLPISDAGGLDLDSKLANTNEVTTARMGALTDWIDGGRLDLLLDAVKAKTDGLPSDPADASVVAGLIAAVEAKVDIIDTVVDTILVDTNELQADWVDGGRLDLILDSRASQTSVNTIDDFLDSEIAAIIATLGVAGAGLSAVPWNAAWDAEVQSEVTDALVAYDPPTHAEVISEVNDVQTDIAALNDLSAAQINAEVDTALADIGLDTLLDPPGEPTAKFAWASATFIDIIAWGGLLSRNKAISTATEVTFRNDADSADIAIFPHSDDGSEFISNEAT